MKNAHSQILLRAIAIRKSEPRDAMSSGELLRRSSFVLIAPENCSARVWGSDCRGTIVTPEFGDTIVEVQKHRGHSGERLYTYNGSAEARASTIGSENLSKRSLAAEKTQFLGANEVSQLKKRSFLEQTKPRSQKNAVSWSKRSPAAQKTQFFGANELPQPQKPSICTQRCLQRHLYYALCSLLLCGIGDAVRLQAQDLIPSPFVSSIQDGSHYQQLLSWTVGTDPAISLEEQARLLCLKPIDRCDSSGLFVSIDHRIGRTHGAFLPSEGNSHNVSNIWASGVVETAAVGKFLAAISYGRSIDRSVSWTSQRDYDLYAPYIAADSSGGDFHAEDYRLCMAWLYNKGIWQPNLQLSFVGEQAYRLTDPRTKNTTTYLQPSVGISYASPRIPYIISLTLDGLYGRQAIHQWNWRPGQQVRFFVSYGFGLCDIAASPIWFGYSRMNYLSGLRASVDILPRYSKSPLRANLSAEYYRAEAEERNGISLFATHNYRMALSAAYIHPRWTLSASADLFHRQGSEYIYEDYRPDEDYHSVYDLRLIDERRRYAHRMVSAQIAGSYSLPIGNAQGLLFGGAVKLFDQEESYRGSPNRIGRTVLTSSARVAYTCAPLTSDSRSALDLSFLLAYRSMLKQQYNVVQTQAEQLDYQLCYLPHLYYAQSGPSFQLSAAYTFPIASGAMSISADAALSIRQSPHDTPVYTGKIGVHGSRMSDPADAVRHSRTYYAKVSVGYAF